MNELLQLICDETDPLCQKIDFSELNGKKILITGASGLLGTYFLSTLHQLKTRYNYNIEIFATGYSAPPEYLSDVFISKTSRYLSCDLENDDFSSHFPMVDYVIHAAGYAQPGRFLESPVKTFFINTKSTHSLLRKLHSAGKFLFVSSSEVYSGLNSPPFSESQIGITNTTHPRACYIEGKRSGEMICNSLKKQGVNAKSARLALAYGPGTKKNDLRVLNSFIRQALLDKKITLLDEGNAKRTYCYVLDAVEIMWKILLQGEDNIYNVGGKSKTTIKELAEEIGKYLNVPVSIPRTTNQLGGAPEDVFVCMKKVEAEFGKNAYISLEEGLKKTILWQSKYLDFYGVL